MANDDILTDLKLGEKELLPGGSTSLTVRVTLPAHRPQVRVFLKLSTGLTASNAKLDPDPQQKQPQNTLLPKSNFTGHTTDDPAWNWDAQVLLADIPAKEAFTGDNGSNPLPLQWSITITAEPMAQLGDKALWLYVLADQQDTFVKRNTDYLTIRDTAHASPVFGNVTLTVQNPQSQDAIFTASGTIYGASDTDPVQKVAMVWDGSYTSSTTTLTPLHLPDHKAAWSFTLTEKRKDIKGFLRPELQATTQTTATARHPVVFADATGLIDVTFNQPSTGAKPLKAGDTLQVIATITPRVNLRRYNVYLKLDDKGQVFTLEKPISIAPHPPPSFVRYNPPHWHNASIDKMQLIAVGLGGQVAPGANAQPIPYTITLPLQVKAGSHAETYHLTIILSDPEAVGSALNSGFGNDTPTPLPLTIAT